MTRIASISPVARFPRVTAVATSVDREPTPSSVHASLTTFGGPRRKGLDSIADGFATMEDRFQPSAAKDLDVRVQFELTGPGGGEWHVEVKDGRCRVRRGRGPKPDTTLTASAADYLKIVNGEMNKILALLRGKLRVRGDMGVVRPFFACFRKA